MMPKETILQLIKENFDNVKHPGNDNLLHEDRYPVDENEVDVFYKYEGKHWSEINEEGPHCLSGQYIHFLSNDALLYVIPYLLQFVVNDDFDLNMSCNLDSIVSKWRKPVDLSTGQALTIYLAISYSLHLFESDSNNYPISDTHPYYHDVVKFRECLVSRYNLQSVISENS